jgi:hypothetical protein
VKPANVLFRTDPAGDRAMLSDLGLGKSLAEVSRITMPGGTPAYVAPEQVMGERLDHRADLYSLGAVAYAAFTGQAPHGVASLGAVMQIDAPPPSMTTLREDVPDAIDVVVRRALEPDRDQRWPDLDSFLNALREAHSTGKVPAGLVPAAAMPAPAATGPVDQETALASSEQSTVAAKPKRRRAGVLTALAAVVLAAGGGYGGYQYVLTRPVTVESAGLSVDVPRRWGQQATDGDSLLVSENASTWLTNPQTEGVFLGLVNATELPTSATPPEGCTIGDPETSENLVTFRYSCDNVPTVLEQYKRIDATRLLRVQVRDDNPKTRESVVRSATYK